ncbi:MAG: T9SS type A sorting domain-containing protein, partial [Bacteroidales bacterium]
RAWASARQGVAHETPTGNRIRRLVRAGRLLHPTGTRGGVLFVDVTPDDAHVTITNELEAVDYGYGDVVLTGLEPGTYWIYAGRDGQMVEATVEVTARWRVMAQIDVGAQERTRITYHEHASNGPFDWDGRTIVMAKGPGGGNGPGGPGDGGGGGGKKGGDYGDLWIIKRDANGAPVLDDNGCVIPLTAGNEELTLVLSTDGPTEKCELAPDDVDLVQEVDFGRLNIVRSPPKVIAKAYEAAMATLNASEEDIFTDPAGRLVATIADVEKTIDSPLENLALYKFMLTALANGEPWPPAGATFVMPSTDLWMEARLNNLDAPSSSTPLLSNFPVTILCTQQTNCQNPGAVDLDGDSLSYALVTPMATYNLWTGYTYVSYIPPNSALQPLPSSPPVSLNPYTGDLCITPTMNIVAPLKIEIKKWREINGVMTLIGVTSRDMQVNSIACNSQIPMLAGIDTTLIHGYDPNDTLFSVEACAGDTVRFAIWGHDTDTFNINNQGSPEEFSIFWNQAIPTANLAVINQSTDSAFGIFTWVPTQQDAGPKPHCFMATIRDKSCPYYLSRNYIYCIKVNPAMQVDIGSDVMICAGDSVSFQAIADSGTVNYFWKVNGISTGTPPSSNMFTFHSTGLIPGVYVISVETNNGNPALICPGKDFAIVEILSNPNPFLGNDTILGLNSSLTLNAGLSGSYLWSTGAMSQIIIADTSLLGSGTHLLWVQVTDSSGCAGSDTIQISFVQNPGISEHQNTGNIRIFPNPTSGAFTIQFPDFLPKSLFIQLTGIDGKVVYENRFELTGKPELVEVFPGILAHGVYLVNIITDKGVFKEKLLIQGQ